MASFDGSVETKDGMLLAARCFMSSPHAARRRSRRARPALHTCASRRPCSGRQRRTNFTLRAAARRWGSPTPPKDSTPTYMMDVNHKEYDGSPPVVLNASYTTNCLAPLAKVVNDKLGIVEGDDGHATTATLLPVGGPAKGWQGLAWWPWLRPDHHPVGTRRRDRWQGAACAERQA
ncbi:hypothetical protein PI124_g19425 [Phytophthora idaei]|nr:hypothetical protein PI125_g18785 [Phytophthora idaei]KAG3149553.1 hypothetical protein PI126_g11965 [Phytophthora idaei]KAG3235541.1 hypothetical protein PI124_g19425 [Phytophthora idaei]